MRNELKLSFIGPSGAGKSTAANLTEQYLTSRGFNVIRLNVAQPLHQIQSFAYQTFDLPNTGQDGQLLQFLASHFETSLATTFRRNYYQVLAQHPHPLAIINSDCRNNAYPALRDLGFHFIHILTNPETIAARLKSRQDITTANSTHPVEAINQIHPNFLISNNDTLAEFSQRLKLIIDYLTTSSNS